MDVQWDDLKTVLALVRHGSLAGAGAALGVNYTTVARRIARIEKAVGEPLFERLKEGYRATGAGRLAASHAETMEERQSAFLRRVQGRDQRLSGRLVVTAPQLLIGAVVAPVIAVFSTRYPEVDLHLRATNDMLDLTRREADLAVRISRDPGDTLTGLRLCAQQTTSFASARWAERIERDPTGPVDWIVHDANPAVPKASLDACPGGRVRLVCNDMVAMLGAAQAGLGVVRLPVFLGRTTPGLERVPALPPQPYADIWVVGHRDVWRAAKVAAFRALLVPHMRRHKADFLA